MSEDAKKKLNDVLELAKAALFDVENGDSSFAQAELAEVVRKLELVITRS